VGSNYDWGQDIPLEWGECRLAQTEFPGRRVALVTEDKSDIAALYPDDRQALESAVGLGDYDAPVVVISQSALRCEARQRRQRYIDFVSAWRARHRGRFTESYPSPTILVLRAGEGSRRSP